MVEVVVNGGVDGGKLLQGLDVPEPCHRPRYCLPTPPPVTLTDPVGGGLALPVQTGRNRRVVHLQCLGQDANAKAEHKI